MTRFLEAKGLKLPQALRKWFLEDLDVFFWLGQPLLQGVSKIWKFFFVLDSRTLII